MNRTQRINNRQELFDWIKEHAKDFEQSAVIEKLENSEREEYKFEIVLKGSTKARAVSKIIRFYSTMESYPMIFEISKNIDKQNTIFDPPKLLKMILVELFKRGSIAEIIPT